jgi:ribonuclease HII
MKVLPGVEEEERLFAQGARSVAGVDEVGRGAWAGPVSVGVAVITPESLRRLPVGVADSKMLSPLQRERLFAPLAEAVFAYAVGHASPQECDALGMTRAQRLATSRAFEMLPVVVDAVIVDGRTDFSGRSDARLIVGADRLCVSVAAASVLAKVTRDRIMSAYEGEFPDFDFEHNKGYPSPSHLSALASHGLTSLHRRSWSFAPLYSTRGSVASAGEA